MNERGAHAHRVARPQHAADLELELERREAPPLRSPVARSDPERRDDVAVGRREAMDVVRERDLAEDVDLVGLHRVAGAVAKALDAGGARAPLAGRAVPVDTARLGGAPLPGGQGPGRATPGVDVTQA